MPDNLVHLHNTHCFPCLLDRSHLECLLTGVLADNVVIPNPHKPVLVPVFVLEAVCGGDQHTRGDDGGSAHEVSLASSLS